MGVPSADDAWERVMRFMDLLRPYLGGVEIVLDRAPAALELRRMVLLGDGIEYETAGSSGAGGRRSPGGATLTLACLGPDPDLHGDPATVFATIDGLEPGARAIVLLGWEATSLPYQRLLEPLVARRCQVIQLSALDDVAAPSAAVIERVDRLVSPRDGTGRPVVAEPADDAEAFALGIRLANERAFGAFVTGGSRSGGDPDDGPPDERWAAERGRMQRKLDEREATIQGLEREIERLRTSASMRVGRTVVDAGRSPRSAIRLPLDLYRIWRRRPR